MKLFYIKFCKIKALILKSKRFRIFIIMIITFFCILLIFLFFILTIQRIHQTEEWTCNSENRIVYLTFDDGPDPVSTPKILNILEQQNIKATFFLIGEKVDKYPQVVRQITEAGHEIGNHGYSHPDYNYLGDEKILQDIHLAQLAIVNVTGKNPTLLRPPYGRFNKDITSIAKSEYLTIVLWSLDPKDFRKNATQDHIIKAIDSKVSNGSIILLHETSDVTISSLPAIIDKLNEKDFLIGSRLEGCFN